ncbi:hypothetical protein IQ273_01135 [Nodosilinea sp. LEGE 07298]|uniref:hypothetical protein n=1 Tax=Nodosilinea sp. LEGE 07298 TaxID=2777970 RepID=UPI00187FE990|nr:hypothetical protein [Nodosilinea sp. LEGE 07298]MBE9108029.1 hypothetical protein [Nodosilinea sp. LEGE 07298]
METQNAPFRPAGSTFFGLLLGLPLATLMGIGMPTAAMAQAPAQPEAPFTEEELEPIEAEIEESIPPALEDSRSNFNIWSEDEYDVFESDDFVINTELRNHCLRRAARSRRRQLHQQCG